MTFFDRIKIFFLNDGRRFGNIFFNEVLFNDKRGELLVAHYSCRKNS